jgi:hypothetical protein
MHGTNDATGLTRPRSGSSLLNEKYRKRVILLADLYERATKQVKVASHHGDGAAASLLLPSRSFSTRRHCNGWYMMVSRCPARFTSLPDALAAYTFASRKQTSLFDGSWPYRDVSRHEKREASPACPTRGALSNPVSSTRSYSSVGGGREVPVFLIPKTVDVYKIAGPVPAPLCRDCSNAIPAHISLNESNSCRDLPAATYRDASLADHSSWSESGR